MLLSNAVIAAQAGRAGLKVTDSHAFGADYARTCAAWNERLNRTAGRARRLGLDDRFLRSWRFTSGSPRRRLRPARPTWCRWNCAMPEPERIWIIGASDGIGAALARTWAARGARLVLSARSADRLRDLCAELGPGHVVLPLDVSDRKTVDAAAEAIGRIGPLDRVVHLAAIYDPGKIADLTPRPRPTSSRST